MSPDLAVLLEYLSHQWLPVPVKEAYRRVSEDQDAAAIAALVAEIEALKKRMTPDGAFF